MTSPGLPSWERRLPCGGYPVMTFSMARWSIETSSPSWEYFSVGGLIERITYYAPIGSDHYCDVYYEGGLVERVFRPRSVAFDMRPPPSPPDALTRLLGARP